VLRERLKFGLLGTQNFFGRVGGFAREKLLHIEQTRNDLLLNHRQ